MTVSTDSPDSTGLQALLEKGAAAAGAGDVATAEAAFREANAVAPGNPLVLHNLGLLLFNAKRTDEAEQVLIEAAKYGARPESLAILSTIFREKKRYPDAIRCLEALLKTDQSKTKELQRYTIHVKIAELKALLGDTAGE